MRGFQCDNLHVTSVNRYREYVKDTEVLLFKKLETYKKAMKQHVLHKTATLIRVTYLFCAVCFRCYSAQPSDSDITVHLSHSRPFHFPAPTCATYGRKLTSYLQHHSRSSVSISRHFSVLPFISVPTHLTYLAFAALASPATGHWGTCHVPPRLPTIYFFRSLQSRTYSEIRLHVVAYRVKIILLVSCPPFAPNPGDATAVGHPHC